jgi:hypothetical protein
MGAHFGPWSPDIDPTERVAEFRSLASLAALLVGSNNPLVAALRLAEQDGAAVGRALELLDGLPALTRRRLLATFGAVQYPPTSGGRS